MITRFAPSPTGPLHLGHAFSALTAFDIAQESGGTFLLRIEDIDRARSRPEWEAQIYDDLAWLGITWERPVLRQSDRLSTYRKVLEELWTRGLLFACSCKRKDIQAAASAPQDGSPIYGPDGIVYPGTCRARRCSDTLRDIPTDMALRLDMAQAVRLTGDLAFDEVIAKGASTLTMREAVESIGDVVLARRDMGTSYHLSVVLDDAYQGVTDVVRGEDLFEATFIHVVLQCLLNLPTPKYHHHRLIRDDAGKRLAKRDDARAISLYRQEGFTPDAVRALVGL